MIRCFFKFKEDVRGQALAEAALVIPILLLLLMGMFVVGFWLNDQLVVTAAAREGARQGALTGDCNSIKTAIENTMKIVESDTNKYEVNIDNLLAPGGFPELGEDLVVQIKYNIPLSFDYFKSEYEKAFGASTFPFASVESQAVAKMEVHPASTTPLSGCQ